MGAIDQGARRGRQMPPWHIDKTVGIQHFKNDRSLTDGADRHHRPLGRCRRAEGRSEGHAAAEDSWPTTTCGDLRQQFGGPPDLIIKSPVYTMPAQALDQWYKPVVETGSPSRDGCAPSRSVPRR